MAVILVTGSEGFIAQHVIRRLLPRHTILGVDSLDARVHPVPPPTPAGYELVVADAAHIPYRMAYDTEILIHLAAQVSVADSAVDPVRYLAQNSIQTAMMLDRAWFPNLKKLLVASSMSVYGEGGFQVTEDHPVCPTSVYGLTKYDQERLCLMWGQQHGIPTYALRFFNVYGPGQSLTNGYTGVLANFAAKLLRDEAPVIFEDGRQSRDFIFVEDIADDLCRIVEDDGTPGVYNLCTGLPTSVETVAVLLAKAMGKPIAPTITGERRPGDIRYCTGDPARFRNEFGWKGRVSVEDGLTRYAAWLTR